MLDEIADGNKAGEVPLFNDRKVPNTPFGHEGKTGHDRGIARHSNGRRRHRLTDGFCKKSCTVFCNAVDDIALRKYADNLRAIHHRQRSDAVFRKAGDNLPDAFIGMRCKHAMLVVAQYFRNSHRLSPYILAPGGTYSIRRPYQAMTQPSRLEDPEYASYAWKRYWRLMRWMLLFTVSVTLLVLGSFWWNNGMVSIHFFIATAGAIIGAMMLTAALMGLVFLSSGTGHDESIEDIFKDEADR